MTKLSALRPYLGVLGAAMIFGSWVVTTSLVDRFKLESSSMQALIESHSTYKCFSRLFLWTRNTDKYMHAQAPPLPESPKIENAAQESFYRATERESEFIMYGTELTDLVGFIELLQQNARKLPENNPLRLRIDTHSEYVWSLNNKFLKTIESFGIAEKAVIARAGGSVSMPQVTPEMAAELSSAATVLERTAKPILNEVLPAVNVALSITDDLIREARQRVDRASFLASWSQTISVFFYVLGTVAVIIGKYHETRDKHSGKGNAEAPPSVEI